MTTLKWGILAAGKICGDFTNALRLHPANEHQVVAIAARKLESAQKFAKDFDIPKAYASYEELVQDPEIDVVYIGSIHPYHYSLCKLAINGGKHIVCEKPMAMNEKQAQEILDLVKEKDLFFLEGFWSRFFPAYVYVREQIKQGAIGDVKFVQASFGISGLHVPRLAEKELGGGALLDLGCYTVQLANMIFNGKPDRIVATGETTPSGVDLWSTTTLFYGNNCSAQITSRMDCELVNNATIHGTKGQITIPSGFWCPTNITTPSGTKEFLLPKAPQSMHFKNSEGFSYEQKYVREAILQGKKECDLMPHADSLQITRIMDEIRKQIGVQYEADQ